MIKFLSNVKVALGYLKRNVYLLKLINLKIALSIFINRIQYIFTSSIIEKNNLDLEKHKIIRNFLLNNVYNNFDFSFDFQSNTEKSTDVKNLPIWVCWWQGEENLPELSRICVERIKKFANQHPVNVITLNNVSNYVSIPNEIWDNYKNGNISPTFLSDFLRASLLGKYGGLWLDSTVFVLDTIDDEYFSRDLVSIKTEKISNSSPSLYRWAGFFLGSKRASPIFCTFRMMFIEYFKHYNKICDYLLIDHFLDIIYYKNKDFKDYIDAEPISNQNLHLLESYLNLPYSAELFSELKKQTNFFKLSYKIPLIEETFQKQKTFWFYIKNEKF